MKKTLILASLLLLSACVEPRTVTRTTTASSSTTATKVPGQPVQVTTTQSGPVTHVETTTHGQVPPPYYGRNYNE